MLQEKHFEAAAWQRIELYSAKQLLNAVPTGTMIVILEKIEYGLFRDIPILRVFK